MDSGGNAHGYKYNITTRRFTKVSFAGAVSLTATAINNNGSVAGFFTDSHSAVKSFLRNPTGKVQVFAFPGADMTQAFGVNDLGEVVGAYTMGANSFGFTWTAHGGFHTVSDPHGLTSTIINGVNNAGDLVGFFTGGDGHVNGMLATP